MRLLRAITPALLVVPLACGGSTSKAGATDGGPGDGGACSPPSPGAWAISASGLDTSCATAADCQSVYIGDDACEVAIVDGGQNMPCPNAAIAASSYDAYRKRYEAINAACAKQCGTGSILCSSVPVRCNAGTCAL